ncbi:hypothetical protein YDYSY3_01990 [Paenibacillus chitinolyticus]|nr:hypothetical protein YDYSY3_01990 [Paenibacillus chitinolyticus]
MGGRAYGYIRVWINGSVEVRFPSPHPVPLHSANPNEPGESVSAGEYDPIREKR